MSDQEDRRDQVVDIVEKSLVENGFKSLQELGMYQMNKGLGNVAAEMAFLVDLGDIARKRYRNLLAEVKRLPPGHKLRQEYLNLCTLMQSVWS